MMTASVVMITYKHEKFIAQAIESVVSQKTNFDFELIIGEDFSPDNTRKICEQYAARYPGIIKLLPSEKNHGMIDNEVRTLKACTGKYIAMCEGDDYWLDEHKLQKQVDFLEANPDFSLIFTDKAELHEHKTVNASGDGAQQGEFLYTEPAQNITRDTYTIEDLIDLRHNPMAIHTSTMVFRNLLAFPLPEFYYKTVSTDYALFLLMGTKGKIRFLNEKTSIYRVHTGGVTWANWHKAKVHESTFDLFDSFNDYTKRKYHKTIRNLLFPAARTLLIYESGLLQGRERRKLIFKMIRAYNKYMIGFNLKEIIYYNLVLFFPFTIRLHKRLSGKPAQRKRAD